MTSSSPLQSAPQGRLAFGFGLATISNGDTVLDVWYPFPTLGPIPADQVGSVPRQLSGLEGERPERRVALRAIATEVDLDAPVTSTEDAYLRLQLLSHLVVAPNTINLEGLIPALPTNVWTNAGPMTPGEYDDLRPALRTAGIVAISLDKFPRLLDYVTPAQVRIADAARVRLGAHLAPGTTVMHEGFVNFNAGTLGTSMVEGRISQGVVVEDGADIGGGASIMGTLSGGGKERITIGKHALLGANAGVGISIGDDSVVEAGLYVTAGTKVAFLNGDAVTMMKAKELSGVSNILFRRNSVTGAVEALPRSGTGITLNSQLHS